MAAIIKKKSPYKVEIPGQKGDLLLIWKGEEEPSKKYIWDDNDELYFWLDTKWILLDKYLTNKNKVLEDNFIERVKQLSLLDFLEIKESL